MKINFNEIQIGKLFVHYNKESDPIIFVKLGYNFAIRVNDEGAVVEVVRLDMKVFEWEKGDCPTCGGTHLCHSCGLSTWCPPDEPFEPYSFCNKCDNRSKGTEGIPVL